MRTRAQSSILGRRNRLIGESHEEWVEGQHQMAGTLGILAHVVHNGAEAKMIKAKLTYVGRGVADYTGVLEGGRYYAAEAKSTSSDRLPKSEVKAKQQEHLDAVARAGGLALLLVEFRHDHAPFFTRFAIPWLDVPWRTLRSAESVGIDEVPDVWVCAPNTCFLSKWHAGGPRSGNGNLGGTRARHRIFATE